MFITKHHLNDYNYQPNVIEEVTFIFPLFLLQRPFYAKIELPQTSIAHIVQGIREVDP